MCCKNFWLRIIPFSLALTFGLLTTAVLQKEAKVKKNQENLSHQNNIILSIGSGSSGRDTGKSFDTPIKDNLLTDSNSDTKSLQIISKPKANYTDTARQNQTQGTVTLRVTFAASGEIGSISPVVELPDGLTEQAILAARGIRFDPAEKNGVPQTVIKQVQYSFTIY